MSDFNIARLKKGSETFEIVINPEVAVKAKKDPSLVSEALIHPKIYSDAKKGNLASENELKNIFKTEDPLKIAEIILKDGVIQVTSEYRKALVDQKKKKIVEYIHRNGIDPRTNAPHPVSRVEAAISDAKVRIDEYKPAEQQVNDIIKVLRPILPIKFVVKELDVIVPALHAGKAYAQLKSFGRLLREDWRNDGAWHAIIEIPGGLEEEFLDLLNRLTKGDGDVKILATRG